MDLLKYVSFKAQWFCCFLASQFLGRSVLYSLQKTFCNLTTSQNVLKVAKSVLPSTVMYLGVYFCLAAIPIFVTRWGFKHSCLSLTASLFSRVWFLKGRKKCVTDGDKFSRILLQGHVNQFTLTLGLGTEPC